MNCPPAVVHAAGGGNFPFRQLCLLPEYRERPSVHCRGPDSNHHWLPQTGAERGNAGYTAAGTSRREIFQRGRCRTLMEDRKLQLKYKLEPACGL